MANAIYTIYLAIRIADADNCPQNLATFGGQTNIKSILLTFPLVWGGSLRSAFVAPPLPNSEVKLKVQILVLKFKKKESS